jgi:hypothetical protein
MCASLSYAIHRLRLEICAKATVWCAPWACSSFYLSIRRVGDLGRLEQVPYIGAWCSGMTGSIEYDHTPQCCRGRWQMVTTLFIHHV